MTFSLTSPSLLPISFLLSLKTSEKKKSLPLRLLIPFDVQVQCKSFKIISGFNGGFPLSLVLMSAVFPGYLCIYIENDLEKNKHMIVNTNETASDDSVTS